MKAPRAVWVITSPSLGAPSSWLSMKRKYLVELVFVAMLATGAGLELGFIIGWMLTR